MTELLKNSTGPVKMLDFIRHLYKRTKILNKLNEKESRDFQEEIVRLLVDGQQNVDRDTYNEIVQGIGFETFVLQILGNVVNRNPFKNQYQLNRNLDSIAENIKKKEEELQKRQKVLQRKEQKVKVSEEKILSTCKQKLAALQSEAVKKIVAKEAQIKKSINVLLNQLKAKQKLILQKCEVVKSNKNTLNQIKEKEKILDDKLKLLQKRQKEIKSKDFEQSLLKKGNELQELEDKNNKLKDQLKQFTTKYKTIELAYRKIKSQNQKLNLQRNELKQKQKNNIKPEQKIQQKNNMNIQLDNLQLSVIHAKQQEAAIQISEQIENKLKQILQLVRNEEKATQVAQIISSILGKPVSYFQNSPQSKENHIIDVSNLSFLKEENSDPHIQILNEIKSIETEDPASKLQVVKNGVIEKMFEKIGALRYPFEICNQLLEKLLPMVQMDEAHDIVSNYLSKQCIIDHIQKVYLCHETSEDIAESSTLILSRVKLWKDELKLTEKFRKSIQIRKKIEPQCSILSLNIKYLLSD